MASTLAKAADPALLSLMMPEAKLLVGIDFSRVSTSPLGRLIAEQSSSVRLSELQRMQGFDLSQSVKEILLGSNGDSADSRSLVLVRGAFPEPSLLAQTAGSKIQTYKGIPVIFTGQGSDATWMALADSSLLMFGDQKSIEAAIDRHESAGLDPKVAGKARDLGSRYDIWMLGLTPEGGLARAAGDPQLAGLLEGDVVKSIVEFGGGVRMGSELSIAFEAVTKTEKDAAGLADVMKFFLGAAAMSAQRGTSSARTTAFLEKLNVRADDRVVRLSLVLTAAEAEKALEAAMSQARQQAAAPAKRDAASDAGATTARPPGGIVIDSSPKEMGTFVIK
jgi:hypothetical protein